MKKGFLSVLLFALLPQFALAYDADLIIKSNLDCEFQIYIPHYYDFLDEYTWRKLGSIDCYDQELHIKITDFSYEGQVEHIPFKIEGCNIAREVKIELVAGKERTFIITATPNEFNNTIDELKGIPECFSSVVAGVNELKSLHGTLWLDTEDEDKNHVMGFFNNLIYRSSGRGLNQGFNYSETQDGYLYYDFSLGVWIESGKYACSDGCVMQGKSFMFFILIPIPLFSNDKWVLVDEDWAP